MSSSVKADVLGGWMRSLSGHSRSVQLLAETGLKHPVVADLVAAVEAHSTHMQTVPVTIDKKLTLFILIFVLFFFFFCCLTVLYFY